MNKTILLLVAAISLVACGGSDSSPSLYEDPTADIGSGDSVNTMPYEDLSDVEISAIAFMREEEKLARDVYLRMYDIWGLGVFSNISDSEQKHMDAVLALIQKYELQDPAAGAPIGVFTDANLQGLYDLLIAQGSASLIDALVVGATIEDLDIYDLHRQLAVVDNEDVTVVFQSLQKGSRNHMRAFYGQLDALNVIYTPVYISQEEYDEIVNSPMERGN